MENNIVRDNPSRSLPSILIELNKAVKALSLYPPNHPSMEGIIRRSYGQCLVSLGATKWLTLTIKKQGFFCDEMPLVGTEEMKDFANYLYSRRLKEITFTDEMTYREWVCLVNILNLNPDNLKQRGGIEKLLSEEGVRGLWIEEMRYEDIVDKAVDLLKDKEEEIGLNGQILIEEGGSKQAVDTDIDKFLESLEGKTKILEEVKEQEEERDLDELLKALENEKDNVKYEGLIRTIVGRGTVLKEDIERYWEELLKILHVFARHSRRDGRPFDMQRTLASQGFNEIYDGKITAVLLRRLCDRKERRQKEIKEIIDVFITVGREVIPHVLDRLVIESDIYSRRILFNLAAAIGDAGRDEVEKRLKLSGEWFVQRQMVSILGAIGNPDSYHVLKDAIKFPDIRVKREILKAMTSIRSKECIEELIKLTLSDEHLISLQAIASLGAIKTPDAIPALVSVADAKGLSLNIFEKKKEAIKALGNVGDQSALSVLIKILKTRRWWQRKRQEELRALAAVSIGKIGGETAEKALIDTAKESKGVMQNVCLRALWRIR